LPHSMPPFTHCPCLLALDASTERWSVAVQRGAALWEVGGAGGAATSAQLLPAITALVARAGLRFVDLHAVVVGCGPGTFTGVRTACAVAQGLAFGAQVPVLPVSSLLAVAEQARAQYGCTDVLAVLDARMTEVYHAHYRYRAGRWNDEAPPGLCAPEALVHTPSPDCVVAGNAQPVYGAQLLALARHVATLPSASALLRLAPALWAQTVPAAQALPHYVRNKVAQTSAERAAAA